MKRYPSRAARETVRLAESHGFEFVSFNGHIKMRSPGGKTVVFSATPSGPRTSANENAMIRRVVREETA